MKKNIFLSILFLSNCLFSQNIDSLRNILKNAKHDTVRCRVLSELINVSGDEDEEWVKYNDQIKIICEKNLKNYSPKQNEYVFFTKYLASAINDIGYQYDVKEKYITALKYYFKGLELRQKIKDSTEIINSYYNIALVYQTLFKYDTAIVYYQKGLIIAETKNDKKNLVGLVNNMGEIYRLRGDIKKALEYFHRTAKLLEEVKNEKETAIVLGTIGVVYDHQGDIPRSIEYRHKSLAIFEKLGDKKRIAETLNGIGTVYVYQKELEKALSYFKKALKIFEEVKDSTGIAGAFHNIAGYHTSIKKYNEALLYHKKSYAIRVKMNDKSGMASSLNSIGFAFRNLNQLDTALSFYYRCLKVCDEIEDRYTAVICSNNIVGILILQEKYIDAEKIAAKNLKNAQQLGFPFEIKGSAKLLSRIYSKTSNFKKAYEMHVLYKQMEDSINNETNKRASLQKSFQYEYDKKAAADSIRNVEEKKVEQAKLVASEARLKQERTQRFALYGGLILVLIFAGFIFNRFKVTQKQKNIIELKEKETYHQKQIIEQKHKEITDSINYAERIQRSFLASKELLDENLDPEAYFILFKPKDIVSGDFYWAAKLSDGNFAITVADSTGHGVPGAIMSLLNITSLEKAAEQSTDPAEILNRTRNTIIERLKKDGTRDGGKDGMDCSLMVFERNKDESVILSIAAANNPVWIVHSELENSLLEISPDKMPVGKHDKDKLSFSKQTIDIKKGSMVYALTDGFPDQFGGPKGKKFMSKNLRQIMVNNHSLPLQQQKQILETTLANWIGDLEQVDDICIIGIRV